MYFTEYPLFKVKLGTVLKPPILVDNMYIQLQADILWKPLSIYAGLFQVYIQFYSFPEIFQEVGR